MREGVGWPRRHRDKRGEPERRPATGGRGGREQQGALYASRSSAKAATALALQGRRKEEGKNEVFSFSLPNPPQDA
jgi:hypothetical protein